MKEFKPRDKLTQRMTRDGAVLDNQTTGEEIHISERDAEKQLSPDGQPVQMGKRDAPMNPAEDAPKHRRQLRPQEQKEPEKEQPKPQQSSAEPFQPQGGSPVSHIPQDIPTSAAPGGTAEKLFDRAAAEHDAHKARQAARMSRDAAQQRYSASRLQFSKEERTSPELHKHIRRAEKAADKLDAAQAAIPKKRVLRKERVFDEASGTAKTKLRFDTVDKSPPKLKPNPLGRPLREVAVQAHGKIHEVEHENVGVESGHKAEELAEHGAGGAIRWERRHRKLKPYRAAEKAERKAVNANAEYLYQKALHDNPEMLSGNPLNRFFQKQQLKREYSGTNFNRPGFQRMLADIKAGRIKRVIVKDMSRFGRDYLQVGMYTDVVFPEFGVHFIAVNDGVDSTRGESEFTAIRNVFNEMYARDTSKKIRATWQSKGKSGEHLTTIPPYGYMKSPEDKKKWIVDEEAAAVVQKIFSLCASGKGPTQIAKWLKQQQILNPTAYCHAKGLPTSNKPTADPYKWTNETVSRILERVDYLGHTVNFKTTKKSYKSKKKIWNDPENWVIFENTQPPIIEESVFLIVQNIRKARRRPTKMGEMGMFSGLLYCAECGGKMYQCRATNFAENQKYFICSTYRKGKDLCTTHSIKNVVLHEIVLRNLREAISYVSEHEAEFIQDAAESDMRDRDAEFVRKRETLAKADTRIAELDRIISRLYEDNVIGKLSDERFIKMSHDYELEQSNLKSMADVLRKDLKQQEQQKTNVKAFIAAVKKYTDLQELDAAVLRAFIDRIEVSHVDKKSRTREITIVYNFIGAFDFTRAIENARNTSKKEQRTA